MFRTLVLITIFVTVSSNRLTADESDVEFRTSGRIPKAGSTRDDNHQRIKFVWCPPGKFTMGSPDVEIVNVFQHDEKQADVVLTHGFWIAQTEVTQAQWERLMGDGVWNRLSEEDYRIKVGTDYPVTYVQRDQALAFCQQMTRQERIAGRLRDTDEYSLPTEAEWEYACRAGTTTRFSFGAEEKDLAKYAWCHDNTCKVNNRYPHRVATKNPNPWGIYDMHGNVNEMCLDVYGEKIPGGTNPFAITTEVKYEGYVVFRGGSWNEMECHSASRNGASAEAVFNNVGFRLVRRRNRNLK